MFEAEATARRASLPTVPETEARKQVSSSAGDCMLDQPKLTWAVDLGERVLAMSTFDLWYALSAGDIGHDVKVWRVGREAWTSALEVPELACALADVDELIPARQTLDYVAQPPSFGSEDLPRPVSGIAATAATTNETSEPAIEMIAERDSHEEVFAHELEEAVEGPESELCEASMRSDELTPSADLPMGQVISLHPASDVPVPPAKKRLLAAAFAVAATLAVGFSFLVAFAAPTVGAEAASAARLPAVETPEAKPGAPLFDMEAEAALAETSSHRIAERLSQELEAAPAAVVRRVKSWSPSDKGQKRKRALSKTTVGNEVENKGKPGRTRSITVPASKPSNSSQKRR